MKKVKLALLASIMALAMLLPLNAAVAAQPQLARDITPQQKLALAIKAPDIAGVGLRVTITVVEKHTGKPVPKAGVWAVDVKDIENGTSDVEDYVALAEEYGQFLGWTNSNGNVFHRFKEAGQYVLVAVKKGFTPGFAIITVKPLKALAIKAPSIAGVDQLVTITVVEKYLGIPIPRAGVWAIDVNDVKEEPDDAQVYASLAEECGQFLGWTNRNGNVFHRFKEAGRYVLVAVKGDLIPGFAKITIVPLRALAIRAPGVAGVGQLVTITVVEKYLGIPIPRAGVWAVNVEDIENETTDDYVALAEECGQFLGWTNRNGNVFHRFKEAGRYVLVAVKDDLIPGFAKITILQLQPAVAEPVATQPVAAMQITRM